MQSLATILSRLYAAGTEGPMPVDAHDVARLQAELGRPLPEALLRIWQRWGAGRLGAVELLGPRAISSGLSLSDRFLDEGLLHFAQGPDGEAWALRLDRAEDPEVLLALDFPTRLRTVLGRLACACEVTALAALEEKGLATAAERARLQALDSDGRFREPAAWASRADRLGA